MIKKYRSIGSSNTSYLAALSSGTSQTKEKLLIKAELIFGIPKPINTSFKYQSIIPSSSISMIKT